jgi:hypothetical protein
MNKFSYSFIILILASFSIMAQQSAFSTSIYRMQESPYRNADGTPSANYWQNKADYKVAVALDTKTDVINGNVVIDYTNKSLNGLSFVWLQLDQNITTATSRAASDVFTTKQKKETKGYNLKSVKIQVNGKWINANYLVNDTRMQIQLANKLPAKNGNLKIQISYSYLLGADDPRSGILKTKNGNIYDVSFFYPRMCVYDDIRGWDTLPYLGSGEFYLDYGNIDYTVTVPKGMLVMGSGELQNPKETLTLKQQERLKKAKNSDKTIFIRTDKEVVKELKNISDESDKQVTWHFKMNNTRDVAWAASKAFVWDAARINLPDDKKSMAMSVYPVESMGKEKWSRATEYLKQSVEYFSNKWFVYPYSNAINVGGPVGGMEFPGITFDSWQSKTKHLYALLSHEIGHNWFPMIVGSNERRNAWMDEGFNTFIDIYAQKAFNNGEYAPKRDNEYAPKGGNPAEEIIAFITKPGIPAIMTAADNFKQEDTHPVSYFKTALGLVLLREIILDPQRFDFAFKNYIQNWAFKHPTPNDFFNAIENGAGEDLTWFWKGWFLNNYKLDQAIKSVKYINNDPTKGTLITLENKDKMLMPVLISVTDASDKTYQIKRPVEIWRIGNIWTLKLDTTTKIKKVILDAQQRLPDINRDNNVWVDNEI